MSKTINLHYWPGMGGKKNFGDELSAFIMGKLLPLNDFVYNKNGSKFDKNLIAIGSYIQLASDGYYIFGSGVRSLKDRVAYEHLNVISVRGPKTREFLLSRGVSCPELYGDPALFVSRYYTPKIIPELNNKIGIVPHITDKTNYASQDKLSRFHLIDPCDDWRRVIDQICSCSHILSSSLHGLICSDAYGIPNLWLEYKDLQEGHFKFEDYFLSQRRAFDKINNIDDLNFDRFYKEGNKINLDQLSKALYDSDLNKKNKKIAIVYNVPKSNIEKYNNWRDGFTEAIKILSSVYNIELINLNDGIGELKGFDWVFVKEGFSGNIFPYIKNKISNSRMGIFVSASNSKPTQDQIDEFDLIFYETDWYAKDSGLDKCPKAFRAFGIDDSLMRKKNNYKKNIDCLFVGAITAYKRPWEILKYSGKKVCVGSIENQKIANFLKDNNVELVDFLSYEKLAELYNKSKKCLVPCELHGGGERAVLEARSCGVEVSVSGDNAKLKELLNTNIFNHIDYCLSVFSAIESFHEEAISLINPTAINYSGKQYILYRGEKYLDGRPPPLGFNRSDFSYWLEVDGATRRCAFNFDNYTYKTIKRIDIDLGSNKSIIEDLRFIESSVRETSEGLICLATCCLLPHTRIFQGTKNKDGSWNKSRGLGLEFTFRAAYCQVNLSTAEIKFIDQVDESSQVQNEKNWSCFIHDDEYYVIYSMFPLIYAKASSLSQVSFKEKNLNQELIYSSSTNPIKINENRYAMLCHKRNKDKEFCYNYQLVTFGIEDRSICDIQCSPVNIDEGCYCSSMIKEGSRIKVFAGVRDLDNKCFYIDIPKMYINQFAGLQAISSNQIPKKIHLSWKNKNVLDSHYELIRKGAKNLELLNPDWDVQVYDDEDVNRLLRDSIGRDNWNLIKDKKITEKTDLWRLLKTYKEGGLYVDIDRYIDTPLSEVVNHKTSCVLPTFQDVDFSQDFILTCAKNPIIGRAIANNLNYRKQGKPLFFLAVYSYMRSVCEILGTKIIDRGNNPEYFNDIRKKINQCEYLETYREIGPEHHTLFRNIDKQFDTQTFEKDKADFYNGEDVVHWNSQTQAFHTSQKIKKQKLIFTQNNLFEQDFICEVFNGFDVVINEDMNIIEQDSVIVYSDMYAKNINAYPQKFRENLNQLRAKQKEYFEKLKNKNCILVHLSDEHCHAEIDHYKNFKHVFRQYYRKDAVADNVTFIPLGYKKGFKS